MHSPDPWICNLLVILFICNMVGFMLYVSLKSIYEKKNRALADQILKPTLSKSKKADYGSTGKKK